MDIYDQQSLASKMCEHFERARKNFFVIFVCMYIQIYIFIYICR